MVYESIIKHLGPQGRMISGSKGRYNEKYPNNFVVFNANICTKDEKVWYGDIDLTKEYKKLIEVSKESKEKLFVLQEMDARFGTEEIVDVNKAVFSVEGKLVHVHSEYYDDFLKLKRKYRTKKQTIKDIAKVGPGIPVDEEVILGSVDLPKIPKNANPFEVIAEALDEKFNVTSISEIVVSQKVAQKLNDKFVQHVKKNKKEYGIMSDYALRKSLMWALLDMSPVNTEEPWAKDDKIYIRRIKGS